MRYGTLAKLNIGSERNACKFARMHLRADLHQLLEINDLMVTPVANIRPGIIWFRNFPINTLTGNSIGVVSICCGGIQKSTDHAFDIFRVGISKRFPVLENIAPVSFVPQLQRTILFFDIDRKSIPGSAGIAMPPAE